MRLAGRLRFRLPPSRLVRGVARAGTPLGVLFGLLALAAVVSLAANLSVDRGRYPVILASGLAAFFGSIASAVGVDLPRNVRCSSASR